MLPNKVMILELIKNRVSILETFPGTGCNVSNTGMLQLCKQPFEIIQGEIAFKNMVQCINGKTAVHCKLTSMVLCTF